MTPYHNPPLADGILRIILWESWTLDDARRGVVRKFDDAVTLRLLPRDADVESDVRYSVVGDEVGFQIQVRNKNGPFPCTAEPEIGNVM